jgi:hypothetical protein
MHRYAYKFESVRVCMGMHTGMYDIHDCLSRCMIFLHGASVGRFKHLSRRNSQCKVEDVTNVCSSKDLLAQCMVSFYKSAVFRCALRSTCSMK